MSSCAPTEIIDKLSCRNTKIRFGIINIFHEIKKPISASEIISILKEKFSTTANKTTVYRQLNFLTEKQIVTSIDIGGIKQYQLNRDKPPQMLVCSICHSMTPVINDISINKEQLTKIEESQKFKINHYSLIIIGNCQKCQK